MAMNGENMGKEINDALIAAGLAANDPNGDAEKRWKVIGKTITDYIAANAEISTSVSTNVVVDTGIPVTVAVPAGTGATTAPGSGLGTGDGQGTIA